jgi:HEAT repeat protein
MGPAAQQAIPVLTEQLQSVAARRREAAAVALRKIDPTLRRPLALLGQALEQDLPALQRLALLGIAELGPGATPLWPVLPPLVAHADPQVRAAAVQAVSAVGADARRTIPVLVGALGDEAAMVRLAVANAFTKLGPAGKLAVPDLVRSLWSESPHTREGAAWALQRIDPRFAETLFSLEAVKLPAEDFP